MCQVDSNEAASIGHSKAQLPHPAAIKTQITEPARRCLGLVRLFRLIAFNAYGMYNSWPSETADSSNPLCSKISRGFKL